MRDPHVVSLKYHVETSGSVEYRTPPPIEYETEEFRLKLENGILECYLKVHFASVNEAKEIVENSLRAWELKTILTEGLGLLKFVFDDAVVIDRNPPPPGSPVELSCVSTTHTRMYANLTAVMGKYPEPPHDFSINDTVNGLFLRYNEYLEGREKLLTTAYFCLSYLESLEGKREKVAEKYGIDIKVLSKLGDLTANYGDVKTARKFCKGSTLKPLTRLGEMWVQEALKKIIFRVGAYQKGCDLTIITMNELPVLPSNRSILFENV